MENSLLIPGTQTSATQTSRTIAREGGREREVQKNAAGVWGSCVYYPQKKLEPLYLEGKNGLSSIQKVWNCTLGERHEWEGHSKDEMCEGKVELK